MDSLIQLDTDILIYLNNLHSLLWDNFFWIYTSVIIWIPFYIAIAWVLFKRLGWNAIWVLLAIGILITLCDQISSSIFKPLFERPRPSKVPALEGILHHVNNYRGGRFGFVSGHATNSFGIATFTSLLFRKRYFTIFIFAWALINSYSRIYLGVHYPGDILGGFILGAFLGWICYVGFNKFSKKYVFNRGDKQPLFGDEVGIAVGVGLLSIIIVFLASDILLK